MDSSPVPCNSTYLPSLVFTTFISTSAFDSHTFFKLRWPSSTPFLFASLKVSIAISLVGAIVGELPAGAQAGLGARLLTGSYYGQTIQIWSALICASILAAILVFLMIAIEKIVLKKMGGRLV